MGPRRPQRRLLAADMVPRFQVRHPMAAGMGQVRATGYLATCPQLFRCRYIVWAKVWNSTTSVCHLKLSPSRGSIA